jgi:hypothetical protein
MVTVTGLGGTAVFLTAMLLLRPSYTSRGFHLCSSDQRINRVIRRIGGGPSTSIASVMHSRCRVGVVCGGAKLLLGHVGTS